MAVEAGLARINDALVAHLLQERDLAVRLAELTGVVNGLSTTMQRVEAHDELQQKTLTTMTELLQQARGGWRLLVTLGAVLAAVAAVVAWLWDHVPFLGGKS